MTGGQKSWGEPTTNYYCCCCCYYCYCCYNYNYYSSFYYYYYCCCYCRCYSCYCYSTAATTSTATATATTTTAINNPNKKVNMSPKVGGRSGPRQRLGGAGGFRGVYRRPEGFTSPFVPRFVFPRFSVGFPLPRVGLPPPQMRPYER